ncbi:hypothetical protein MPH_04603 [Macrophomina phaseolina MS6]|uniref:Uncharacterized protein n=1 Tax=Macrophomina phaseolina (strain MS6) TaxID=1126212 RepID=K2RTV2_MACPH|nr:hypothetical protein MPH_04603 [Macrophomina phaseolina MS6]
MIRTRSRSTMDAMVGAPGALVRSVSLLGSGNIFRRGPARPHPCLPARPQLPPHRSPLEPTAFGAVTSRLPTASPGAAIRQSRQGTASAGGECVPMGIYTQCQDGACQCATTRSASRRTRATGRYRALCSCPFTSAGTPRVPGRVEASNMPPRLGVIATPCTHVWRLEAFMRAAHPRHLRPDEYFISPCTLKAAIAILYDAFEYTINYPEFLCARVSLAPKKP